MIILIFAKHFGTLLYLPFLFEIANSVLLAGMITFHQYPPVTVIRAVSAKNPNDQFFEENKGKLKLFSCNTVHGEVVTEE